LGVENQDFNVDLLPQTIPTPIRPPATQVPFEYVFKYSVEGIRINTHQSSNAFQIHIIQDFEFDEQSKIFSYRSKLISIALLVVKFRGGSLLVTACSGCATRSNLQMFLPLGPCLNLDHPPFSVDRFICCKHTASVLSELFDRHRIASNINIKEKHDLLINSLDTWTNQHIHTGWQNLGKRILTDRNQLYSCFLTNEYHLLCFYISRLSNSETVLFLCSICNKRNCSHCKVVQQENFSDAVPIARSDNYKNSNARYTFYSSLTYPFDYGGFDNDTSPDLTNNARKTIKSRAVEGSNYFLVRFPDKILKNNSIMCCSNQCFTLRNRFPILIFLPQEILSEFNTDVYSCDNCKKTFYYEGRENCLLNFDNRHFICAELFYSLLDLKLRTGLATNAWWNSLVEIYARLIVNQDHKTALRRKLERLSGRINQYFIDFLKLLEYSNSHIKCCDGSPDIITLDGIVMSIEAQRIRDANLSQPWITETNFNRQSTRKDRNVLELNLAQKKLLDLYTSRTGVMINDFDHLCSEYSGNPVLVLMKASASIVGGCYVSHPLLRRMVRSFRKDISPAISILPSLLWIDVEKFLNHTIDIFTLVSVT
jgi:hypothetical protein